MKVTRQHKVLALLTVTAVAGWTWIFAREGYLKPVEQGLYFAGGQSGPRPGTTMPQSPMVDVTGSWKGKTHCYT